MEPNNHQTEVVIKEKFNYPVQSAVVIGTIFSLLAVFIYLYFFSAEKLHVDSPVENEAVVIDPSAELEKRKAEFAGDTYVVAVYDENIGIYLTHRDNDQTLYQRTDGFCQEECLNDWVPYSIDREFTQGRLRSVLVNEEYGLYYVLLDDKMLFTYNEDQPLLNFEEVGLVSPLGIINGNNVDGVWEVARP
jgi:predicted lipoprotein with Yx(FWY)xxD motif